MKKTLLLILATSLFFVACEKSSTSPTSPPPCEKNHTATVTMKNAQTSTYSLTIAGTTKTIAAGSTVTYSSVPSSTTSGTCVMNGSTFTITFPSALVDCKTSAFQY